MTVYAPYYRYEITSVDYAREAFEGLCVADKLTIRRKAADVRLRLRACGERITDDEALVLLWKIGRTLSEYEEPETKAPTERR